MIAEAASAGATAFTHFGNGIPNVVPRHANPMWPALAEERLSAMIVTDGHHLPPSVITTAMRAKGVERTIAVSDASPMVGMPSGHNEASGNRIVLEPNEQSAQPGERVSRVVFGDDACLYEPCGIAGRIVA